MSDERDWLDLCDILFPPAVLSLMGLAGWVVITFLA